MGRSGLAPPSASHAARKDNSPPSPLIRYCHFAAGWRHSRRFSRRGPGHFCGTAPDHRASWRRVVRRGVWECPRQGRHRPQCCRGQPGTSVGGYAGWGGAAPRGARWCATGYPACAPRRWLSEQFLTRQDGLSSNIIFALAKGRDGSIWAATDDGVTRIRRRWERRLG